MVHIYKLDKDKCMVLNVLVSRSTREEVRLKLGTAMALKLSCELE